MSLNVFLPRYSNLPLCAEGVIYSDDYLVFSGHAISNCSLLQMLAHSPPELCILWMILHTYLLKFF